MSQLVSAPKAGPIPKQLREDVAAIYLSRWWVKALLATQDDKLGLILRAAFACPTVDPPWLGPTAIIDDAGAVLSNWVDASNRMTFAAAVCTLQELVDNARDLCERLNFTQAEAEALFQRLRQWITIDARPKSEQAEDRIPLEAYVLHRAGRKRRTS